MPRKIDIVVKSCDDCPLCIWDGYYDCNVDAGWNCGHPDATRLRIVDEGGYDDIHNKCGVVGRIGKPFPDFCPLKECDEDISYNGYHKIYY